MFVPLSTCRHHVEDVAAGFALGLTLAFLFYRSVYAGVMSSQAGSLASEGGSSGNGGGGGGLAFGRRGAGAGSLDHGGALDPDERV
jgi:hypothetical protein